uniref:Odorant receptor n=1 Tax=Ceracris kiangsu TaxID=227354 RepID=A0A6M6DM20_CERKI|nr:odorant receptor 86 [Ceracris kiangsu]
MPPRTTCCCTLPVLTQFEVSDENRRQSDGFPLLGPGATLRRVMGLWRPEGGGGGGWRGGGARAAVTLAAIAFPVACSVLKLCADPPRPLEEVTLCGFVACMDFGFLIKAALFIKQRGTMRQLVRLLWETREKYTNGQNNERARARYQKLVRRMYVYMQAVVVPALACWVWSPLLSRAVLTSRQNATDASRQLPVHVWLPADVNRSPTYEALFAAQSFSLMVLSQATVCMDVFFVHLMLMVAAELEVLNNNVSTMQRGNVQRGRSTYVETTVIQDENNGGPTFTSSDHCLGVAVTSSQRDQNEHMYVELVKNVRHHQAVLSSVNLLQKAMNPSIFILLFINMANLCGTVFVAAVLLQRDGNITKALKELMLIPCVLYETGMYCICGHMIINQSEKLVMSAFSCGWTDCDRRFKRSLLIFMMAAMRPLEITVGKMCKLSKQMLLQVLNGSYALLNMLYHFHRTL